MATVRVGDVELYYERQGSGPRVLFLNGSGGTIEASRLLLAPFVDRFDLAVHDQRGLRVHAADVPTQNHVHPLVDRQGPVRLARMDSAPCV